jgi:hypothetical protein
MKPSFIKTWLPGNEDKRISEKREINKVSPEVAQADFPKRVLKQ